MSFDVLPSRRLMPTLFFAGAMLASNAMAQQFSCDAFLASALQAPSSPGAKLKEAKTKSFYARIEFTESFQYEPGFVGCLGLPGLHGTVDGQGNAQYLGQTALHSENCAFSLYAGGPLNFLGADVRLTAANGDLVRARYCGVAIPRGSAPVQNDIFGRYVITGGTGRFDGATGAGKISGMETLRLISSPIGIIPDLGHADVVLDGEIAY